MSMLEMDLERQALQMQKDLREELHTEDPAFRK